MAKVKTSSLLAEIRGNLGGSVFSSNASGFYVKSLVIPVNPRKPLQLAQRLRLSDAAATWRTVTPAELADWVTFAADASNERYDYFGDPYYPSPYQQFQSINLYSQLAGAGTLTTAPAGGLPAALPSMEVYVDFQSVVEDSYVTNLAAFDASIEYVATYLAIWPNSQATTPPRAPALLAVVPVGDFPDYILQTLMTDRWGTLPTTGRWQAILLPLTSEFRPGTAVTLAAFDQESDSS